MDKRKFSDWTIPIKDMIPKNYSWEDDSELNTSDDVPYNSNLPWLGLEEADILFKADSMYINSSEEGDGSRSSLTDPRAWVDRYEDCKTTNLFVSKDVMRRRLLSDAETVSPFKVDESLLVVPETPESKLCEMEITSSALRSRTKRKLNLSPTKLVLEFANKKQKNCKKSCIGGDAPLRS